jgi:hypothetical protein
MSTRGAPADADRSSCPRSRATLSDGSEQTAQRLVAGSFLLLVPYFLYEAIRRLVDGGHPGSKVLGIAVTASAIVLMPGLGVIVRRSDEPACHIFGSGGTPV